MKDVLAALRNPVSNPGMLFGKAVEKAKRSVGVVSAVPISKCVTIKSKKYARECPKHPKAKCFKNFAVGHTATKAAGNGSANLSTVDIVFNSTLPEHPLIRC